jgi:hypothetical protein
MIERVVYGRIYGGLVLGARVIDRVNLLTVVLKFRLVVSVYSLPRAVGDRASASG